MKFEYLFIFIALGSLFGCSSDAEFEKVVKLEIEERLGDAVGTIVVKKLDGRDINLFGQNFYKGTFNISFNLKTQITDCLRKNAFQCEPSGPGKVTFKDDYVLEKWESGWRISSAQL